MTDPQAPLKLLPLDAPEWRILLDAMIDCEWQAFDHGPDPEATELLLRAAVAVCPEYSRALRMSVSLHDEAAEALPGEAGEIHGKVADILSRMLPEPNDDA